jgi:hypothetical protein
MVPNLFGSDEWVDLIPLALVPLLLLVLAYALLQGRSPANVPGPGGAQGERARLVHRAIDTLPQTMTVRAVLIPVGIWVVTVYIGWRLTVNSGFWHQTAVMTVHLLAAVLTIWFISGGRLGGAKVRQLLSASADVVGFWPIRSHPFAGLSYREPVIKELRHTVEVQLAADQQPISFVGHSQGSVLAAWLFADPYAWTASKHRLQLVTCGSPLRSLYGALFTAHFSAAFFASVAGNVARWDNFWRNTDPIATPMPSPPPSAVDTRIDDHDVVRGHSDYWIESDLRAATGTHHTTS